MLSMNTTIAIANLPAEPAEGPLYGIQLHMDLVGTLSRSTGWFSSDASGRDRAGTDQQDRSNRAPTVRLSSVCAHRSNWHPAISMVRLAT